MKTRLLFLILFALPLVAELRAEVSDQIPIAVLNIAGPRRTLANNIASLLTVNLSAEPHFAMVDRNQLNKVLEEQALGRSGNISPETATRIGHLTGAKILITGREFSSNERNGIVVIGDVIGAETGRVFSHTVKGSATNLVDLVSELSTKIVQTINDKSTNLINASVEAPENRLDTLIASFKGQKLPTVMIRIDEQTDGRSGSSQTASSELGRILQKAGFSLLDEQSKMRPDITITGDAVTAPPTRKGDMISCRATVQIKAVERSSGKILSLDVQQGTAPDSGEQTAIAKSLQNAVDALAERLLPRLVAKEEKKQLH